MNQTSTFFSPQTTIVPVTTKKGRKAKKSPDEKKFGPVSAQALAKAKAKNKYVRVGFETPGSVSITSAEDKWKKTGVAAYAKHLTDRVKGEKRKAVGGGIDYTYLPSIQTVRVVVNPQGQQVLEAWEGETFIASKWGLLKNYLLARGVPEEYAKYVLATQTINALIYFPAQQVINHANKNADQHNLFGVMLQDLYSPVSADVANTYKLQLVPGTKYIDLLLAGAQSKYELYNREFARSAAITKVAKDKKVEDMGRFRDIHVIDQFIWSGSHLKIFHTATLGPDGKVQIVPKSQRIKVSGESTAARFRALLSSDNIKDGTNVISISKYSKDRKLTKKKRPENPKGVFITVTFDNVTISNVVITNDEVSVEHFLEDLGQSKEIAKAAAESVKLALRAKRLAAEDKAAKKSEPVIIPDSVLHRQVIAPKQNLVPASQVPVVSPEIASALGAPVLSASATGEELPLSLEATTSNPVNPGSILGVPTASNPAAGSGGLLRIPSNGGTGAPASTTNPGAGIFTFGTTGQ